MEALLFWSAAAAMVVFTLLTISSHNPVYSAIWMILSFAATAGLFVLLDAHLIAAVEVLVYAGAIMVLFLFVIMLINLRSEEHEGLRFNPLAILAAATFLFLVTRALNDLGPATSQLPNELQGSPGVVADALFSRYAVAFETVSVLLLAAILGTVVLSRKSHGR
ncbi:MAG TPA: NADH-quinone oxidoreductase subunit J [Planctomycetota bacterium]|nr:NADH-quinone oxidoreductase subunit J [Planctomycetota bacterium]